MPRPTPAPGMAKISAPAGPGISRRTGTALDHGQLRHPQRAARKSLAQEASTLCLPLRSDQFELAQLGRALVRGAERESDPAREFRECSGFAAGHRELPGGVERQT